LKHAAIVADQKSYEMSDIIIRKLGDNPSVSLNVHDLLTLVTLDVIGLVGFGYDFGALKAFDNNDGVEALGSLNWLLSVIVKVSY
jgi:hypothetical protein